MKAHIILQTALLVVLFAFQTNAQQHDNLWMIGQEDNNGKSTILRFNNNTLSVDSIYRNLPMYRASNVTCDSTGQLYFYTNGIEVFNTNKQLIQNGDSLNPGNIANTRRNVGYTLQNSIISLPLTNNKYLLLHQSLVQASDQTGLAEYLYYTTVDMNANNGLGQVISKNNRLVSDSIGSGQLQAVKHGNGKDWWVVQHIAWSNGFYIFLVANDTITLEHKQYIGNNNRDGFTTWLGQSTFSPDGMTYARYDYDNDLDIFNFNRCSGRFSNPVHIPIQDTIDVFGGTFTGVAISPNSQFLYLSSYSQVYQFDLSAINIATTQTTVAIHDGFRGPLFNLPTVFRQMQLAPDGKIYIMSDEFNLHTIDNPNQRGVSCNVNQRSVNTYTFINPFLPNHPHYRTPPLAGSPCDTLLMSTAPRVATNSYDITLFPNPTSDLLHLQAKQPIQQLLIYDALGRVILQQDNLQQQELDLDTHTLAVGTYFISIWVEGQLIRERFQIVR